MNLPNLGDPENWMASAAVIALVLSQLPPILPRVWGRIRGSEVLLASQDSFGLNHHLGRAFLVLHIQIENTGSNPVAIAKIDCVVRRVATGEASPASTVWRIPARTYYAESSQSSSSGAPPRLFIGTIHLKPGEFWQEVVHCYGPRSQGDEEKAQEIQYRFANYIGQELDVRRENRTDDGRYVEVSKELVDEARQFANEMFNFTKGEYELYIAARDRSGRILGVTKNRFILYENMINILRGIFDDYQYGFGVSEPALTYRRPFLEPRLTLLGSDQGVRREYEAIAID